MRTQPALHTLSPFTIVPHAAREGSEAHDALVQDHVVVRGVFSFSYLPTPRKGVGKWSRSGGWYWGSGLGGQPWPPGAPLQTQQGGKSGSISKRCDLNPVSDSSSSSQVGIGRDREDTDPQP